MAVSGKNRRKIKYKGENFLWWVGAESDGLGNMLSVNVTSEDKKFIIKCFAFQHNLGKCYLTVIGQHFPGLIQKTGNSLKLDCPNFSDALSDGNVTPKTIKVILDWCFGRSYSV